MNLAASDASAETSDSSRVRRWTFDLNPKTRLQAERCARSPAVTGHVALMPDAHYGYGSTIGSVIPTAGAIIPAAVGVDIGCGMIATRTNLEASDLPDNLNGLLSRVSETIPSFAHESSLPSSDKWLTDNPLRDPSIVKERTKQRMGSQMGTLGSGNHFVEISFDETDTVWCVLHSGSRGIGNALAMRHMNDSKQLCRELHRSVEDPDLSYYLSSDPGFREYIADMLWAQDYAHTNREIMMDSLLRVVRDELSHDVKVLERVNCHHNYAAKETHYGREMWITRKGAIRAGVGDRGVIPGSMGADTYIVTGKGNPLSWMSASHGAGRRLSRGQAKRELDINEFSERMKGKCWQSESATNLLDEAPDAYKDISQVMASQTDLVSVDHKLSAVLNYKGC